MTTTHSTLVSDDRNVLLDFRADLMQHLTVITAIFSIGAGYALIFLKPLPHKMVFSLYLFGGFILLIRYFSHRHPNLARYVFVGSLYIGLGVSMVFVPVLWLPFLIFPLLLISGVLVSHINTLVALLFFFFLMCLNYSGHANYPLQPLVFLLCFTIAVTNAVNQTCNTVLVWYRLMYQRADDLLQETRIRRAELTRTLKNLEVAYEVQQRRQKQLMYARQQAEEARRMKERFASNISHELRTPLNIILGFTEIMHLTPEVYGDISFPPKLHHDIYQIQRNSRHLLELIDDVLDLSHIEMSQFSLNFELTNLNQFLDDTVEMVSDLFRNKPIDFIVDIKPDLPTIEIDRTRIRQAIINLLNNAYRFTSSGSVTLCAEALEEEVLFKIADTGSGVAADKLDLIFEEFYQGNYSLSRAYGGAGLGLPITKRFVEAHNGKLHVESVEGHGSVFTFSLPIPKKQHFDWEQINQTGTQESVILEPIWLVVDADPQVSKLITRHTQGRRIVQVEDDTTIQEFIQQYNPQGIIINNPPDQPLADHLANLSVPTVKCWLPSTMPMIQKLGVDAFLEKPVRPQQIIDQLRHYPNLRSILVVDDDLGVVQLVQRSIETQYPHLQVLRAYDGVQALEIMRSSPPDLALLDLVMHDMSGFEIIETMRGDPVIACIPVILLTATKHLYTEEENRADMLISQTGGLPPSGVLKLICSVMETIENLSPS